MGECEQGRLHQGLPLMASMNALAAAMHQTVMLNRLFRWLVGRSFVARK